MSQANNFGAYLEKLAGPRQRMLEHVRALRRIERDLLALIGGEPGERFRVANLRDDVLIIQAQTTTWATRIRYLAPEILQRLQQEHPQYARLKKIDIHMAPDPLQQEKSLQNRPSISNHSLGSLRDAVRDITDQPLREAFERLIRHARRAEGGED